MYTFSFKPSIGLKFSNLGLMFSCLGLKFKFNFKELMCKWLAIDWYGCSCTRTKYTMHNKFSNFLCFASFVFIFVQYRTISIAMTRTGPKVNETTDLQTPYFKYAFGEFKNCRRGQ